jgi:hypothetical protein
MGFFFSKERPKVDKSKFDKILHEAGLSSEQREHIHSQLEGKGHVDEKDVTDLVKGLKEDTNDGINPQSADKIREHFDAHTAPPEHNEPPTMDRPKF